MAHHYKTKPWVWSAARGMMRAAEQGCGAELMLSRALMAGCVIEPFKGTNETWSAKWVALNPDMGRMGAVLGLTPEMAAFRWLNQHYPELLKVQHAK